MHAHVGVLMFVEALGYKLGKTKIVEARELEIENRDFMPVLLQLERQVTAYETTTPCENVLHAMDLWKEAQSA